MSNMLWYLAAPYSAKTEEETESRMKQFFRCDAALTRHGINTVSPLYKHQIVAFEGINSDWVYWKKYSETLLAKCDGILVLTLDKWMDSIGVTGEIEFATRRNIRII
jgi:hypothetical protein